MSTFQAQLNEKVGLVLSQLTCAICLDIYTDPVVLPCGNIFCKQCIRRHRDSILSSRYQSEGEQQQKFACPSCRVELGPRTSMPENVYIKELADLARRTVGKWELHFGKEYSAPKVSVPLSQSTYSSSSGFSIVTLSRQHSNENEPPPRLSLFGEMPSAKNDNSALNRQPKNGSIQSPPPPILSPGPPLQSIQPQAGLDFVQPVSHFVSPKVYGRSSNPSSSVVSKPPEKDNGLVFSKPLGKDPYEFKGSQSQDDDSNVVPVVVGTKRKSAESKAGNAKRATIEHSEMPPPKVKRATKSGGGTAKSKETVIDVLSSQNPAIQRMRSIIQSAEQVELVVKDRPVESPPHRHQQPHKPQETFSVPQKRVIEKEHRNDDNANSAKKAKTMEVPISQTKPSESTAKLQKEFGIAYDMLFDDPESNDNDLPPIPPEANNAIPTSNTAATFSLSLSDNTPPIANNPVSMIVESAQPTVPCLIERKEMKDVSIETPAVSGYILLWPDGTTVMTAVKKYLIDASVQTDELVVPVQIVDSVKKLRPAETQTDVVATGLAEVQTDSVKTGVVEIQTEEIEALEVMETHEPPPGLARTVSIVDEASTYWSIPQDVRVITADSQPSVAPKSAACSLQPSASSLGPDSLANFAVLCRNDEDADGIADTMVANSNDELDFVGSTPPHDTDNVVMASQPTVSNPPPDSVDVVASSVQSFLRSQDPNGISNANLQISVIEDKITPGRTIMNLTEITPATELAMPKVTDDDNRGLLTNFMNRISNQFNGAQAQSSTPSGVALRRLPFTTQDPAVPSPPKPPQQPVTLPPVMPSAELSILPQSQADLPQLLRDARAQTSTISLTSSGCTQHEPYLSALKSFCDMFKCRQTNSFLVKATTHVVLKTLPGHDPYRVCDRTMKFLMAMAARRWVVSIQWVLDSMREGCVMPEENYEITGDTSTTPDHCGPTKARSSRVGLFTDLEICCPENSFVNPTFTRDNVFDLIELCGGTRIDSPDAFSYRRGTKRIIAIEEPVSDSGQMVPPSAEEIKRRKDMHRRYKAVILSVDWILDSISRCQKIDASLPINSAYRLFSCPNSELAVLASNN